MKQLLLIPNILTLSRIFLIFPSIYFLEKSEFLIASLLILIVLLTDFFDGYLARKLNQTSYLGAILDPVADKLVVIAFFTYLFFVDLASPIYFCIILTRDILQLLSIPIILLWKKIEFKVKPKMIARVGTALNFIILALYEINFVIIKIPELTKQYENNVKLLNLYGLAPLIFISICIEIYILVTFIPRFYQIYRGTHDTFE